MFVHDINWVEVLSSLDIQNNWNMFVATYTYSAIASFVPTFVAM